MCAAVVKPKPDKRWPRTMAGHWKAGASQVGNTASAGYLPLRLRHFCRRNLICAGQILSGLRVARARVESLNGEMTRVGICGDKARSKSARRTKSRRAEVRTAVGSTHGFVLA